MSTMPFIDLKAQYKRLKPQIDAAIHEVLDDGQYVLGPYIKRFESELAEFCGVKHVVTVASGTDALFIPMLALGIGPQLLGHSAFNWALKHVSATMIAIAILGEPVGSSILAWLIFGEAFRPLQLAGFVLLLAGIVVAARAETRAGATAE